MPLPDQEFERRMPLDDEAALALAGVADLDALMAAARRLRDARFGDLVTYSRKVFIPLTQLCRDVCHYCTFAHPPRPGESAYMSRDAVLAVARRGAAAGCQEALFTLGDKPELRYARARDALAALGHASTLSYLAETAAAVWRETGLLPHLNAGVMTIDELLRLRAVAVSQGLMLESAAARLCARGGPHFGSPDKHPAARLGVIRAAGEAAIPFTTGLLIGIGETRAERIEALLELRRLHARYGHIQEVIIQPFRAKPGTRMAQAPEPTLRELLWTIAVARLVLGPGISVQSPPNLSGDAAGRLIDAGIDDWGGVSPVTPDHVNPERPWPHLDRLEAITRAAGKVLAPRLPIYPRYAICPRRWLEPAFVRDVLARIDATGRLREDTWTAGSGAAPPHRPRQVPAGASIGTSTWGLDRLLAQALAGDRLGEAEIAGLFEVRGGALRAVLDAADALRHEVVGADVSYVVNRNINYTNICTYRCQFCAFSKGKTADGLRGRAYLLDLDEIVRRALEAEASSATEVCLQGGIHPSFTGNTYLDICGAIHAAAPDLHIHAFSPLEVWHGATTLGLPLARYLERLQAAGLRSLPGTAAEILDDEVRAIICPDKLSTAQWLEVVEAAHQVGLRTTSTIMFGHVDRPVHWARHLLRLRDLQARTGGITELVPLPFVHMEAPMFLKGACRRGPTFREALLMHALARLVLHPLITNIQTSWVKMGLDGALACLEAGANDLGGTLMNESITRAAGGVNGQEMTAARLMQAIQSRGRRPRRRTTLYQRCRTARSDGSLAIL